ncbi:MAG: hypothetical protein NT038_05120 [Euryarchaeota archaeon]|nr:hypothetical protein [Euryarchaeota archaeon]
MKIERRLTLLGVLLVVVSTVMATQYATTKVSFSYSVVHPSEADIRFVGSDNSSNDGLRVLRINGANGTNALITVELGNWAANENKTYTAAFAIVNEEGFAVNLTHVTVTNTSGENDYMQIWLHGNGSLKASDDPTAVFVYNNGSNYYTSSSTAWILARGDGNVGTMLTNASDNATKIFTAWDEAAGIHVQYTQNLSGPTDDAYQANGADTDHSVDNASDFVWVQISINVPPVATGGAHGGTIEFNFQASTHYGEV